MISPAQYEEFFLPRDRHIAAAFETLGIHNCAWNADPYMELYATVPNLGYIDMGIKSNLKKARARSQPNQRTIAENGNNGFGISFGGVWCQGQPAGECRDAE